MTSTPSVDLLIVSYNTRELLRDCLTSVRQHMPDPRDLALTVSVLDNASTDGSADMVADAFPDVRLVRSDVNLGFGGGTNRLAATSAADYLMPLNSDTVWTGDVVSPLLEVLRADPAIAIVGPRLVWPDGRLQLSSQQFPTIGFEIALALKGTKAARMPFGLWDAESVIGRVHQQHEPADGPPRDTEFLWATCWLLRSDDFPDGEIFDDGFPMYDEDLDLCKRLRARGRRIVYVPSIELCHVGGASSTARSKQALMRRARLRFYRRHAGSLAGAAFVLSGRVSEAIKELNGRRRSMLGGR